MERGETKTPFAGPGDELDRYFSMPKHFVGPETADDLFSIYEALVNDPKPGPSYFLIGGSAAAESGLVGTHLGHAERHRRVQSAHDAWLYAQELSIQKRIDKYHAGEWTESKLLMFSDRVESQLIFTNLFHDLIDGNVRPETIASTHNRLVRLGVTNLKMYLQALDARDSGAVSGRRGLAHEIATPATITRLHCPSFFAIPAVIRSDNGTYNRDFTHDVQLIEQSWGTIRSAIPIEVKTSGRSVHNRSARYKSAMVKGSIHLNMPSAETPFHLAAYLDKERRGDATRREIDELNEITSRVLRTAESYLQSRKIGQQTLSALQKIA